VKFHQQYGKIATITTVNVGQKFGVIEMDSNNSIKAFREKSDSDGSVINGGFMVFQPQIFDYIEGDSTVFERAPLEAMANLGELKGYKHDGFWHCMDTQRDKMNLEGLWASGKAPWKVW
jgi:glucose-1-phosphate cytidylyltransferase